jgi:predicted dehydrogenase
VLKAGFIGFGRMGITHFSILNSHPSVEIIAVCDASKTMLKILKKYVDVAVFTNYEKMLDEMDLDFLIISTPADSHAEIVKAGIAKNLSIFVEKPFTLNTAQGKEILALSRAPMQVNQVGYVCRFHDVFMEVKKLLDSNLLGEIKRFKSEMHGPTITKDAKYSWRGKKSLGGGCMFEYASHCIDLAIYLFGKPDEVSGSVLQSVYSSDVEDIVSSTFLYDDGMNGTVLANWSDESFRKPTNRIEVFGKKGKIIADQYSYKIFLKEDYPENGLVKGWNSRYITDLAENVRFDVRGRVFTRQLDYFVDCIEKKRTDNISSFAEALKTDEIMEKIRNDASRSLAVESIEPLSTPVMMKELRQPSIWKKFTNLISR